jgi:hypothetical protein
MLPKLQQSSLANSLRRDNLASQIQCTYPTIKARINSKAWSAGRTIKCTNLGKINTPPKTLTVPSVISPKSICRKKNWRRQRTSQFISSPSPDPSISIRKLMVAEERPPVLWKKSRTLWSQHQNQEPFKKDRSPYRSFAATMIEEIFPSKSTIKILCPN